MTVRSSCLAIVSRALVASVTLAASGCTPGHVNDNDSGVPGACMARYSGFRRSLEVAVILDRSCAMTDRFDGSAASGPDDAEGRWNAVAGALTDAGMDTARVEGWSLLFAPEDPTMCDPSGELAIAAEPYSGEQLGDVLSAAGATPFDACASGMSELPLEASLGVIADSPDVGTVSDPLLIVIAAGAPSCGSTTTSLEIAAGDVPYDLAVLALAPDDTATPLLESIVVPDELGMRPGYHVATSAAEVSTELDAIIDAHDDCVIDLVSNDDVPIEDESMLHVWVDGEAVEPDPDQGWAWADEGAITLNGALCDRLHAGDITRIEGSLGCDEEQCVAIAPDENGDGDEACDGLDNDCDDAVDENCE